MAHPSPIPYVQHHGHGGLRSNQSVQLWGEMDTLQVGVHDHEYFALGAAHPFLLAAISPAEAYPPEGLLEERVLDDRGGRVSGVVDAITPATHCDDARAVEPKDGEQPKSCRRIACLRVFSGSHGLLIAVVQRSCSDRIASCCRMFTVAVE